MRRPGAPGWGLGAGLTIQPSKKVIVKKSKKGRPEPDLGCRAVDDDDEEFTRLSS
jgi:hypothetical protein